MKFIIDPASNFIDEWMECFFSPASDELHQKRNGRIKRTQARAGSAATGRNMGRTSQCKFRAALCRLF